MRCGMPEERLVDYLYHELDGAALAEARQHIAGCAECQASLGEMGQTAHLLRAWRDEEPAVKLVFSQRWAPSRTGRLRHHLVGVAGSRFAWGVLSGVAAALVMMALYNRAQPSQSLPDPLPPAGASEMAAADLVTQEDLKALQQTMLAQIAQMLEAEGQRRDARQGTAGLRALASRRSDASVPQAKGPARGAAPSTAPSAIAADPPLPETAVPAPAQTPRLPRSGPEVGVRPQGSHDPGALPAGPPALR